MVKEHRNKSDTTEIKEKQIDQLKAITDKLEKGVKEIFHSNQYKKLLDTMAKFPRYSINNSLLIMMQKPEAQLCQSFTGWKKMKRYVKKGEKGIKIIAPTPYTIEKEQNKIDENTGRVVVDSDGEPLKEKLEISMNGFKVVNTFDISQTEGEELPSIGVSELVGNIEGYHNFFEALKLICPVPIAFEKVEGEAKGYYHLLEKRIAIREGMSELQTVKTAIHEMAHQKLHDNNKTSDENQTRNSQEIEAESVAYVVCQHYGIDTSDYSFGYVATWSAGKETPELKASLGRIRDAAADMIGGIDEKLELGKDSIDRNTNDQEKETAIQNNGVTVMKSSQKTSVKEKIKEEQFQEKKKPGRKPKVSKTKEERA